MSTKAHMTLANNSGSIITSTVSNIKCMYENGNNDSHLEEFNATIENGSAISDVVIATIADGDCNTIQSRFSLNFFDAFRNPLAEIDLDLGRGKFKTKVTGNSSPRLVGADISGKKTNHTIKIDLMPMAQALLNSLIWANVPIVDAIPLPSFKGTAGPITFTFKEGLLSGLDKLTCTKASLKGSPDTGVIGTAQLKAPELFSSGKVHITDLGTTSAGLTLNQPELTVTIKMQMKSDGKLDVKVTNLTLDSTGVSAKIDFIEIPQAVLSALVTVIEFAVNEGPLHDFLLRKLNDALSKLLNNL